MQQLVNSTLVQLTTHNNSQERLRQPCVDAELLNGGTEEPANGRGSTTTSQTLAACSCPETNSSTHTLTASTPEQ
jgi:hypothetical protein